MLLEQGEGLIMRRPEGEELDAMLLVSEDLSLELRDMLLPPIVGYLSKAHLRDHRGSLLGRALLIVERYDAPGREILQLIQRLRRRQRHQGKQECAKQSHRGHPKTASPPQGYQSFQP